jgi:hypothetical protein
MGGWNQMPVDIDRRLNRAVAHLVADVGERHPRLDQQASEGVALMPTSRVEPAREALAAN